MEKRRRFDVFSRKRTSCPLPHLKSRFTSKSSEDEVHSFINKIRMMKNLIILHYMLYVLYYIVRIICCTYDIVDSRML